MPPRTLPVRLALLFALALPCCARAQTPLPSLQQAGVLGQEFFDRSGATGMVLLVVRDHEVFFRGFGQTAPGSGQPPTPDSLLRLCSLSKIFTSDLLVKLAQDRTLALDDPLQRFAPDHAEVPSRDGHAITLLELATHTGGLPREIGWPPNGTPHFTYPDFDQRWQWLASEQLRFVPGTVALYSNIGYDLLGDALAAAAHESFARLLYERTTLPLGMRQTGFTPTPEQCARLLRGGRDEGPCTDTQATAASSGLYSTPTDVSRWLQYLLGTATPAIPAQSPAAQAVYLQPAQLRRRSGLDLAGVPTGIGLGWLHLGPAGDPGALIQKTGGGAGFHTYIVLNQPHHTALFFALTEGRYRNRAPLFKEANNLLLVLAGLPPLPADPVLPAVPRRRGRSPARTPPSAPRSALRSAPHTRHRRSRASRGLH